MLARMLFLFALCLLSFSCTNEKKEENSPANKKHNVVWIVLEDQSPQFFPMYGDSTISLPAIEGLAKESVIYDNAFANVPVCAPARSTIILGMYTINTATHNMRTYNAYNPKGEESINVPAYTPVMEAGVREFPKYLRAQGYYCTNNAKEDYNLQHTDGTWDESSKKATWRNRSAGQPFFSIFNYVKCHESGIWRFGQDSLFADPTKVNVPPYFPDNDIVRHDLAVNYSNLKRVDREIGQMISKLKADGLYEDSYIFFYGDHGGPFPRHKRSLYDTGIRVPLFVKLPNSLTVDNVQSRTDEIISFVDLAPTMLSIAGIQKPANMHGEAFLGKYKGKINEYVFASSDRFDAMYDRKRTIRSKKYKYIKNFKPEIPYALPVEYREQMSLMQNLRKLDAEGSLTGAPALWMRDRKDDEEFFNIETDPFELHNLIDDPKYKNEVVKMKSALENWMREMKDQGAHDEQELIKKWAKMKSEIKLLPPSVQIVDNKMVATQNSNYGNIVYQSDSENNWNPYDKPLPLEENAKFKTVHIGLEDSALTSAKE